MNPALRAALLLTLAVSAALALWPEADAPVEPVDATARAAGPTAAARATAEPTAAPALAMPVAADARPADLPAQDTPVPLRALDWPELSAAGRAAWAARLPAAPQTSGGTAAAAQPAAARSVAAAPASAVPGAPPLPWQWVGVYDDGQAVQALLAGRQRSVSLRAGQVLERDWRLDAIETGQLRWTWLPGAVPVVQQARLQVDARATGP